LFQPARTSCTTGITREVFVWYCAKFGIALVILGQISARRPAQPLAIEVLVD
jgi:hypothetical protein